MKKESANNIKLGVFISTGLLLFLFAIYSIGKQQRLFGSTFTIGALFYDVNGLQIGHNVRFSGITIGTVNNISIISDSLVKVEMIIEEDKRKFIKKDANAVIGSEGLMGNKVVNILPGAGKEVISHNDLILSDKSIDIDNLLRSIQTTANNMEIITGNLAEISQLTLSGKGILGTLLMDSIIPKHIAKSLKNINEGAKGFQENMEAAKDNILLRRHFKRKEKEKKKKENQLDEKKKSNKIRDFFRRKNDDNN
ncbi:MAG: MlaD family protein [Bacteroidota bacterium]|nr:MlaD family protein [Bacteroidota bacterium]